MSQVRPIYVALNGDSLQVVSASEIQPAHMGVYGEFSHLPWSDPKLVCFRSPANEAETKEAFGLSSSGIAQYHAPKYFKACDKNQLILAAKPITEIKKIARESKDNEMLNTLEEITDIDQKYIWMAMKSRFSDSIALINVTTEKPEYVLDKNRKLH